MEKHFGRYGTCTHLYMPANDRGMCFITFNDPATLSAVISNALHVLGGQKLIVDFAKPTKGKGKGKRFHPYNGQPPV